MIQESEAGDSKDYLFLSCDKTGMGEEGEWSLGVHPLIMPDKAW